MFNLAEENNELPDYATLSPSLALELAADLVPPEDIFERHGISLQTGAIMLDSPVFQSMIAQAKSEWGSHENAAERIRTKSRLILEELLPSHYRLAMDDSTPGNVRNEAMKLFKGLAGMDAKEAAAATGDRFSIVINLGDEDTRNVSITTPVVIDNEEDD